MPQLPSRAKPNWYVSHLIMEGDESNVFSFSVTRIFSEKEIQIARSRMPSERKFLTGLFKWEDIKRWHTTWPVYLCEILKP